VSKASRSVYYNVYTIAQVAMFASKLSERLVSKEGMCCRLHSSDALVPTQPASARRLLSDELEAVPGEEHTKLPNSHRDGSLLQADLLQRYALTGPLCPLPCYPECYPLGVLCRVYNVALSTVTRHQLRVMRSPLIIGILTTWQGIQSRLQCNTAKVPPST